MSETWFSFATKRPGPPAKQGYPGNPKRTTIDGICAHSMEGSLTAALGELDNPARQASWTFSNPKSGPLLQHYPIESITWASGSVVANTRFLGVESEGVAGDLLNANQQKNMQDLMRAFPSMKWERKATLWEHREMVQFGSSPTACPSNRYPWPQLVAGLKEDEVPTQAEWEQFTKDVIAADKSLQDQIAALTADLASLTANVVAADASLQAQIDAKGDGKHSHE